MNQEKVIYEGYIWYGFKIKRNKSKVISYRIFVKYTRVLYDFLEKERHNHVAFTT